MRVYFALIIPLKRVKRRKSYEEGHEKELNETNCHNDHRCRDAFSLAALAACSKKQDDTEIRIAALKGPTGMGMVKLADKQNYPNYTVSIEASPDALNPRIISGEVDVAAVPVNLASVLYNKLDGDISVLAVSTLGVLYVVEAGSEVNSVADLAGKTVYATGQGATPEYILNYLLDKNGVAGSVEVNYVGEHAALATMLADGSAEIGMLPEPNVTSTLAGNDNLRIALNLTEEWNKVCSTELVQGVVIARKSFVNEHPEAIEQFLREYEKSSAFVNENIDEAAKLIVDVGILGNVEIAKKAIPNCNISFSKGEAMHKAVEGMLAVLFEANPKSIGGKLPDKDFYYGI